MKSLVGICTNVWLFRENPKRLCAMFWRGEKRTGWTNGDIEIWQVLVQAGVEKAEVDALRKRWLGKPAHDVKVELTNWWEETFKAGRLF